MQEFIVSTLEDENDGNHDAGDLSLREAIAIADPGAAITFDSSLTDGTIKLVLGELAIDKDLTIQGLGADNLTVDGSFLRGEFGSFISSRVFNINDGDDATSSNVTIEGITITGGELVFASDAGSGGAGIFNRENLSLNSSIVKDNNAPGRYGAGISNEGNLVVNSSLITENNAGYRGGVSGAGFGGGIYNRRGTAKIVNSTITENTASIGGGIDNGATLEISNSTITSNTADLSSFSESIGNGISGSATITNSIVAGNGINDFGGEGEKAVLTSGGNNLIGNGDGSTGLTDGVNGDLVGTKENPIDPNLGELQDNGGATPTQELLEGSPAIDAGSNPDNLATDQRGEGFNRTVGDGTDIGAFEVQDSDENGGGGNSSNLVVSTLEDESDGDFGEGDLSLREAIALANEQEGADTITFNSNLSGGTIAFAESQERNLTIDDSVSINGLGQDNLTLDGGFIFNIANAETDVAIDGLNLTGGKIDSNGNLNLTNSTISETIAIEGSSDNSAIISKGTTTISDSTIRDNSGGGNVGILVESGTTNIERSTIANNRADQAQAGILVRSDASLDLSNSTVANNQGRSRGGIDNDGTLNVTNSTIVNNDGGLNAGGILNTGSANITSSIVANNNLGGIPIGDVSGDGEFISGGNNLISNGDDATGFVDSDIVGTVDNPIDPQLGELQDNGGATPTQELLEESPAIDAGSNPDNLATDQRGEGFDRTVGNGTDIGAFEVQDGGTDGGGNSSNLVVSTLEDESDGDFSQGDLSLREAIANSKEGDTITFDSNLSGGSIILSQGELWLS